MARITSGCSATSSFAKVRVRSIPPAAQRTSNRTVRPSIQPNSASARAKLESQPLQGNTSTIPIVFVLVSDPVGAGFVTSLRRPGGNMTGFTNIEGAGFGGKWLEMLKAIAPRLRRVAIMFNPDTAPGGGAFFQRPFEAAARSLAVSRSRPVSVAMLKSKRR